MKLIYTSIVCFFLAGCSVKIKDMQFCSPVPGGLGAVCDNFLTKNQLILDAVQWQAKQAQWLEDEGGVECTTTRSLGDVKKEIEKLCSVASCDYETKKKILNGLRKMQVVGKTTSSFVP